MRLNERAELPRVGEWIVGDRPHERQGGQVLALSERKTGMTVRFGREVWVYTVRDRTMRYREAEAAEAAKGE